MATIRRRTEFERQRPRPRLRSNLSPVQKAFCEQVLGMSRRFLESQDARYVHPTRLLQERHQIACLEDILELADRPANDIDAAVIRMAFLTIQHLRGLVQLPPLIPPIN
ncbi:unnamed protein product [Caenorhabditis sp. 36 PRJEB53466]|nr:unnamed protein product [Caenorhabditis sp. 36 PRJEB53466]